MRPGDIHRQLMRDQVQVKARDAVLLLCALLLTIPVWLLLGWAERAAPRQLGFAIAALLPGAAAWSVAVWHVMQRCCAICPYAG